jgi:proteasome assembly chaperone (PAC2) family protein
MPYQYPLFLSSNKKYEAIFHDHNIIAIYLVEENKCREMYRIIIEDYVPQEIFVSDCGRVLICGPDYYRDTVDDEAIVVYIDGKKKKSIQYAIFLI